MEYLLCGVMLSSVLLIVIAIKSRKSDSKSDTIDII